MKRKCTVYFTFFFFSEDRSVYTLNAPTFPDAFLWAVLYEVGLWECTLWKLIRKRASV